MQQQIASKLYDSPFPIEAYRDRVAQVQRAMGHYDLDALLTCSLANICYLTGYETIATRKLYVLLIPAQGDPILLGEDFELHNVLTSCWLDQLVTYPCLEGHTHQLKTMLQEHGLTNKKIGIDPGCSKQLPCLFDKQVADINFTPVPVLIEQIRAIKSQEEIDIIRQASKLSSKAMAAAINAVAVGKTDNEIAAAAYESLIIGGSEYMCLDPIVTVGLRSGIPHTSHRRVAIDEGDAVFIEVGACICRYSAPMMRTVVMAPISKALQQMVDACYGSVQALVQFIEPGICASEVAGRAKAVLTHLPDDLVWHGYYGYSVGIGFPPSWDDAPVYIAEESDSVLKPGMVFHCNTSLRKIGQYGAAYGETVLVTEDGCEVLT
jgi:Xaa-Pro dipeptidase